MNLEEEVRVAELRPTQLNVGWWEVRERAAKLARRRRRECERYLARKAGRVILGPCGTRYLVDGHHLALAIRESGVSDRMRTIVVADWSRLDREAFFARMQREGALYLYDRGCGPLDPSALPKRVKGLTDDPHRSLAWAVRRSGAYAKWSTSFSEFEWADFFRPRVAIGRGDAAFAKAVRVARASATRLPLGVVKDEPSVKRSPDRSVLTPFSYRIAPGYRSQACRSG